MQIKFLTIRPTKYTLQTDSMVNIICSCIVSMSRIWSMVLFAVELSVRFFKLVLIKYTLYILSFLQFLWFNSQDKQKQNFIKFKYSTKGISLKITTQYATRFKIYYQKLLLPAKQITTPTMRLNIKLKLGKLLQSVAENERMSEIIKQVLAEKIDFEPYAVFRALDRFSNGYLVRSDLLNFLWRNNSDATEEDVNNLMEQIDTDFRGKVSYKNFLNLILPKANNFLRNRVLNRQHSANELVSYDVEWALVRIFNQEIKANRQVGILKRDLQDSFGFNSMAVFNYLDQESFGFLDSECFELFQEEINMELTNDLLEALMRRFDPNGKGRISYSEFVERITPFVSSLSPIILRTRSVTKRRRPRSVSRSRKKDLDNWYDNYITRTAEKKRKRNLEIWYDDYLFKAEKERIRQQVWYNSYLAKTAEKQRLKRIEAISRRLRSASPVRRKISSPSLYDTRLMILKQKQDELARKQAEVDDFASEVFNTPVKKRIYRSPSTFTTQYKTPTKRNASPSQQREKYEVVKSLKDNIDQNRQLEDSKQTLSLRNDFNALDAFRLFDMTGKGYINARELSDGLLRLSISVDTSDIALFIQKYDTDRLGVIKYSDFCEAIFPKTSEYSNLLSSRIPSYKQIKNVNFDQLFSFETRMLFRQVMKDLFSKAATSEHLRQSLVKRPLFSAYNAFKNLDVSGTGQISKGDLKETLEDYGVFSTKQDLDHLVDDFTKNGRGNISYSEFMSEITPKSPSKY